jgi:hypothetical protein
LLKSRKEEMLKQIAQEIDDKVSIERMDEKVDTSQFFVCRNLFCDGAYCLKCETFLKKPELPSHLCSVDPVDKLYEKVIETLATSSTRTCPNCGTSGMKDLECTHITCDKCSHRFCYVCGVSESKLEGGFEAHNQWDIHQAEDVSRCPMYLHYKWGIPENPAAALESFHQELQTKALLKLRAEVDNEGLWMEMVKKKFQDQPIVPLPAYVVIIEPRGQDYPPEPHTNVEAELTPRQRCLSDAQGYVLFVMGIYAMIYILFFMAIYCWMIHQGRIELKASVTLSSCFVWSLTDVYSAHNLLRSSQLYRDLWHGQ